MVALKPIVKNQTTSAQEQQQLAVGDLVDITTIGANLAKVADPQPSGITFIQVNANGTITLLNAADFLTAIGAEPQPH